jgi:hypothetical protein
MGDIRGRQKYRHTGEGRYPVSENHCFGFAEALFSAPDARHYFLLSCQKKVSKENARPQRRPAFAGCSALLSRNGRAAELGAAPLRQSSPFFPLRLALLDDAKGKLKTDRVITAMRIKLRSVFSPLVKRRATECGRGVVGEDCLRAVGPSSAAARPYE